jgi:hypothetical protein
MGATISSFANEAHNYMFGTFMVAGWLYIITNFEKLISSGHGLLFSYIMFALVMVFVLLDITFCAIILQKNTITDNSVKNALWFELAGNSIGAIVLFSKLFTAHKHIYGKYK